MNWRDNVRRVLDGDPEALNEFATFATRAARAFTDPMEQSVTTRIVDWASRVQGKAPSKWHRHDVQCDCSTGGSRCARRADARCIVCFRNVCLPHSMLSPDADLLCVHCVVFARNHAPRHVGGTDDAWSAPAGDRQAPPQQPQEVDRRALKEAYATMGVAADVAQEDLDRKLRDLRVKNHPDRYKSEQAKKKAEERFKKIGAAYDLIMKARKVEGKA